MTLSEAKKIYRTGNGHFFDRDTMEFWGSRIESGLYKNRCFITSEDDGTGTYRAYTIRRFSPDFLHINTVGAFQAYKTKIAAKDAVKEVH